MLQKLNKQKCSCWYFVEGNKLFGIHSDLRGNVTGLSGYVTGLSGDVTGLRGNVTGLSGYVSGLSGDVTGLSGNVNECKLSDNDRDAGIDIQKLVMEERCGNS